MRAFRKTRVEQGFSQPSVRSGRWRCAPTDLAFFALLAFGLSACPSAPKAPEASSSPTPFGSDAAAAASGNMPGGVPGGIPGEVPPGVPGGSPTNPGTGANPVYMPQGANAQPVAGANQVALKGTLKLAEGAPAGVIQIDVNAPGGSGQQGPMVSQRLASAGAFTIVVPKNAGSINFMIYVGVRDNDPGSVGPQNIFSWGPIQVAEEGMNDLVIDLSSQMGGVQAMPVPGAAGQPPPAQAPTAPAYGQVTVPSTGVLPPPVLESARGTAPAPVQPGAQTIPDEGAELPAGNYAKPSK